MAHDNSDPMRQALALLEAGNAGAACPALKKLCDARPSDPQAWHFLGICHNALGNTLEAEKCLRTAIACQSPSAYTYSNLGTLLVKQDRFDEAMPFFERAVEINPELADAYVGLAYVHLQQGRFREAETACERAARMAPELAEAHYTRGLICTAQKDWTSAIKHYDRSLQLNPGNSNAHNNLGIAYASLNDLDRAIASYQSAIRIDRGNHKAHVNLGISCAQKRMFPEAISEYRAALAIDAEYPAAHFNLGVAYSAQHETDLAINSYRAATRHKPDYVEAWVNLGVIYIEMMQMDESELCLKHALEIDPRNQDAMYNLTVSLLHQGRLEEAISQYQELFKIAPNHRMGWDNYLYFLNFLPTADPTFISDEHKRWGRRPDPGAAQRGLARKFDIRNKQRLKIGYVSPDFRSHSVSYFLEPILANHRPENVEVYCYAELQKADAVTHRLRSLGHHWRTTTGASDTEVAKLVSDDGIDVLIDLAGHSSGNRLEVFSYRPAPVQVTYLGYPSTTGHPEIDYLLTDAWADPQGTEKYFVEKLVRLPDSFCCYQPPSDSPALSPLPCTNHGHITFASLNNQIKLNDEVLSLWGDILDALPGSKLVLQAREFTDDSNRSRFQNRLVHNGVDVTKVRLLSSMTFREHLAVYQDVDIALDTFPWCGHTTSCHALWMGVPIVTLSGDRHATRMASSILHNIGLPDLIANTHDEYAGIALRLSRDRPRLATLRATMRERMLSSPLCNGAAFTRNLEDAYRMMWTSMRQQQAELKHH